jgi:hypothetical protein
VIGDVHLNETATGIARTAQVLAKTRNRAMLSILTECLHSSRPKVRAAAIRAAIRRHDSATHTQLIKCFDSLPPADQAVLCAAHASMPHHAAPALRTAVLKADGSTCKNACHIVAMSHDFEMLPTLLKAVEKKSHRNRTEVAATILELASAVIHLAKHWAAGDQLSPRDPSFARHQMLASLEQSLSRFATHRRQEVLDAFVLLAPLENKTVIRILQDSSHPCHQATVNELTSSEDPVIVERLRKAMGDMDVAAPILEIISNRNDQTFIDIFLRGLKPPVSIRVLHNMKRLKRVAWLEQNHDALLELDGRSQALVVELATASAMNRDQLFALLEFLLHNGLAEGRRASCRAMARFDSPHADELILRALEDPDSGVQAAAVRQLRDRQTPDALQRLVALLDSPSHEIRDAARSSLAEFNFTRYRTMFDLLDEQAARTTGALVRKVDHTTQQQLTDELSSPSLTSKLRAIEMAIAMEATVDIEQQLIELLSHENVALRKEVVSALGHCHTLRAAQALEFATSDQTASVAEAAHEALGYFGLSTPPTVSQTFAENVP